jgi:hypothetical protein
MVEMKVILKAGYKEMKAKIDIREEKSEASIYSIWPELKETMKHSVEDVLSYVDQKTQGPRMELTENIEETGRFTGKSSWKP